MNLFDQLEALQERALHDPDICRQLMETRKDPDPLFAFCKACQALGYEIYPMELVMAGEEFYAAMKRSTNGGGENSPMLEGEDDLYEMFFAALEHSIEHM